MARLLFVLALLCVICGIAISHSRPKIQQKEDFVVEEGVYETIGTSKPAPPPPKQCQEIQKLESLIGMFRKTRNWSILVEVGDTYARGCFPFYSADADTACTIYKVASRCPDMLVAARAMSRFADTRLSPVSRRDSAGKRFPSHFAKQLCAHAEYHIERAPPTFNRTRRQAVPNAPAPTPDAVVAPLTVDRQNVHDHSVSRTIKKNVKDIIDHNDTYDRIELVDAVMSDLRKTNLSEAMLTDAFRVLVSLVPDKIESIGCSQLDVLNATRKKIETMGDEGVRKNLTETLGKNLASGIEHNHVVCSTGKIARIISTLEGTDLVKHKAVPIEIVRREIAALASKIREDVLSEVSQSEVDEYNTLPTSSLSVRMRQRFQHQVNAIYVRDLGFSEKVLAPMLAMYSSEF